MCHRGCKTKRSQTHHLTPEWVWQLLANERWEFASHLFVQHVVAVEQKILWARGKDCDSFYEGYGILMRIPSCLCPHLPLFCPVPLLMHIV